MKNIFCSLSDLTNEAAVEVRFVAPLLKELGYSSKEVSLKTAIREFKVGKGSKSMLYKPDFILNPHGVPTVVLDAKSPAEPLENWEQQCSSYCLELNKLFDYNPVQYFVLTNGSKTAVCKWDVKGAVVALAFSDFVKGNSKFAELKKLLSKASIQSVAIKLKDELDDSYFKFEKISLSDLINKFHANASVHLDEGEDESKCRISGTY